MEKTQSFKLIDGTFSAAEAENILYTLISSKINFHSMESFSNTERFNQDDSHHTKRILELKESKKQLDLIINTAKQNNTELTIESDINIYFK
jgi:hypothetical protein